MVHVKICGLSRPEDIVYANLLKPDYIGFVFAKSRRKVDHNTAANLRQQLDKDIASVGVFANAEIKDISILSKEGVIGMVQLHGEEDASYITEVKKRTGLRIIKSIPIGESIDLAKMPNYNENCPDYLLFDTEGGGSGRSFDWQLLKKIRIPLPYFIAGGINVSNAGFAASLVPYGIDASSGAETDGIKDLNKMRGIIEAAKFVNEKSLKN